MRDFSRQNYADIASSFMLCDAPTDVSDATAHYNRQLENMMDKNGPLKTKLIVERTNSEWFTDEHTSHEMYKAMNSLSAPAIQDMFVTVAQVHTRQTRSVSQNKLYRSKCKLGLGKRNFRYMGCVNCDKLPIEIKNNVNLDQFKNACLVYYAKL